MSDDQPTPAEERNARVIARATFQRAAQSTGDIETIRAAALTLHRTYNTDDTTTRPKEGNR